jgi:SAM-dependent methyltransferase
LQEYYEESYRSERGRGTDELLREATGLAKGLFNFAVESKDRFLPGVDWKGLRVLETGAGRGGAGLLLARLGAAVTLVDFSPTALAQARDLYAAEGLDVTVVDGDVTHPDMALSHPFDLIVDSHLLHCLTEDPDRASYYRLVSDHLSPEGIFVAETMVHRKKLFIPDGFMYDERAVLWQLLGTWTPVRRILDSLVLEEELNSARFNIVYFYYYGQYGFVPHRSFLDLPAEILPAAVRLVVKNRQERF